VWRSLLVVEGLFGGDHAAKVVRCGGSWEVFVTPLGASEICWRPDAESAKQAAEDALVCLAHRINFALGDKRAT
jgi:hypothetical protein